MSQALFRQDQSGVSCVGDLAKEISAAFCQLAKILIQGTRWASRAAKVPANPTV